MARFLNAVVFGTNVTVMLSSAEVTIAGPYEKGIAAFTKGDYETALQEFIKADKQNEAGAQFIPHFPDRR